MRSFLLVVCLGFFVGCGSKQNAENIAIDLVPEAMMKLAQEELPQVKFENAIKHPDGSYEVRGKGPDGKIRDVEFSAKGVIVDVE